MLAADVQYFVLGRWRRHSDHSDIAVPPGRNAPRRPPFMSKSTTATRSASAHVHRPAVFEELSARLETVEPTSVADDELVATAEAFWAVLEETIAVLEETVDVIGTIDVEALREAVDADELPDTIDTDRLADAIEHGDADGAIETIGAIDLTELLEAVDLLALWRSVDLPAMLREGGELKIEIDALEAAIDALPDGEEEGEVLE